MCFETVVSMFILYIYIYIYTVYICSQYIYTVDTDMTYIYTVDTDMYDTDMTGEGLLRTRISSIR